MIRPDALRRGDRIAIVSPATKVAPCWVEGAVAELERLGYRPEPSPHVSGPASGSFAASDADRLDDLRRALADPGVKAILCARGGYGCVHLLSDDLQRLVADNPKWLVGFSDISALHALWQMAGVESIHCSMAKQLTLFGLDPESEEGAALPASEIPDAEGLEHIGFTTRLMLGLLADEVAPESATVEAAAAEGSRAGVAEGEMVGGNLAVLNGLAATPWDILTPEYLRGKLLFLEDIGEKIYQVERMLTRLRLAGALDAAAGIVFGRFTEYSPDANHDSMEDMICRRLREWGITKPIATRFPIGHTSYNVPIVEGRRMRLEVTPDATARLTYL